jgi:hypothetical protein
MTETDQINDKILQILVPSSSLDLTSILTHITEKDWDYIIDRGREHRFLPLLHWTLERSGVLIQVPQRAATAMSNARRRSTLRALAAQREILLLHRLLAGADIPHVFLKGAYLSRFAYPHPALRPLRDLDVVVASDAVSHAYDLLQAQGYTPIEDRPVDVETHVQRNKHLPGLRSPSGKICVEVHAHIDHPGGKLAKLDALQNVILKQVGNDAIPFMEPTDLFIHLCVHAADIHAFNNGPLIISDIGFLLKSGEIDLHRVASRAAELGVTESVALTLALMESCWQLKNNEIGAFFNPVPEKVVQDARQLCFQSFKARFDLALSVELAKEASLSGRVARLIQKVFPSAEMIALEFGPSQSRADYALHVFKRWRRIVTERIPSILMSMRQHNHRANVYRAKRVREFLQRP